MEGSEFGELLRRLSSPRAGERLKGMDLISAKAGRAIVRKLDDPRAVPLLIHGLGDSNRRVQRAAARGLRPWLARDPSILDSALAVYATDRFDGSYSHAGLYDIRSGAVWVPRFAAVSGHAALLRDGNTDRFFRFDFFVPGQAPRWIPDATGGAHLVLYVVPEWSYSRQDLIPEFDERRAKANLREQGRYGSAIEEFYARARLPYDVRVHRVFGGGGHHRRRELDVATIHGVTAP